MNTRNGKGKGKNISDRDERQLRYGSGRETSMAQTELQRSKDIGSSLYQPSDIQEAMPTTAVPAKQTMRSYNPDNSQMTNLIDLKRWFEMEEKPFTKKNAHLYMRVDWYWKEISTIKSQFGMSKEATIEGLKQRVVQEDLECQEILKQKQLELKLKEESAARTKTKSGTVVESIQKTESISGTKHVNPPDQINKTSLINPISTAEADLYADDTQTFHSQDRVENTFESQADNNYKYTGHEAPHQHSQDVLTKAAVEMRSQVVNRAADLRPEQQQHFQFGQHEFAPQESLRESEDHTKKQLENLLINTEISPLNNGFKVKDQFGITRNIKANGGGLKTENPPVEIEFWKAPALMIDKDYVNKQQANSWTQRTRGDYVKWYSGLRQSLDARYPHLDTEWRLIISNGVHLNFPYGADRSFLYQLRNQGVFECPQCHQKQSSTHKVKNSQNCGCLGNPKVQYFPPRIKRLLGVFCLACPGKNRLNGPSKQVVNFFFSMHLGYCHTLEELEAAHYDKEIVDQDVAHWYRLYFNFHSQIKEAVDKAHPTASDWLLMKEIPCYSHLKSILETHIENNPVNRDVDMIEDDNGYIGIFDFDKHMWTNKCVRSWYNIAASRYINIGADEMKPLIFTIDNAQNSSTMLQSYVYFNEKPPMVDCSSFIMLAPKITPEEIQKVNKYHEVWFELQKRWPKPEDMNLLVRVTNIHFTKADGRLVIFTQKIGSSLIQVCRDLVTQGPPSVEKFRWLCRCMSTLYKDISKVIGEGFFMGNVGEDQIHFDYHGTALKLIVPFFVQKDLGVDYQSLRQPYYPKQKRDPDTGEHLLDLQAAFVLHLKCFAILEGKEGLLDDEQEPFTYIQSVFTKGVMKKYKEEHGFEDLQTLQVPCNWDELTIIQIFGQIYQWGQQDTLTDKVQGRNLHLISVANLKRISQWFDQFNQDATVSIRKKPKRNELAKHLSMSQVSNIYFK